MQKEDLEKVRRSLTNALKIANKSYETIEPESIGTDKDFQLQQLKEALSKGLLAIEKLAK